MILQVLLVVCLWLVSSSSASNHCEVLGLPSDNTQRGNVYFVHYDIPSVELALQCRCTISTPSWVRYNVLNDTFSDDVPKSVECVKNGEDCSPTTHISPSKAAPGYYLYQNYTFKIEQPTVLLCSSTSDKIAVIVRVSIREDEPSGNNTTAEVQPCSQTLLPIPLSQTTAHTVTSTTIVPIVESTTLPPEPALTVSTSTSTTDDRVTETAIQTTTTDSTIRTVMSESTAIITPSLVPAAGESRGKDGGGSSSELGSSSATFAAIVSFTALLLLLNIALILYIIYLRKALDDTKMPNRFRYATNMSGSRRRLTAPESTECSTDDQLSQSSSLRRTSSV